MKNIYLFSLLIQNKVLYLHIQTIKTNTTMSTINKLSATRFNTTLHLLLLVREKIIKYIGQTIQSMPQQTVVFSYGTQSILRAGKAYYLKRMFLENNSVIVVADIQDSHTTRMELEVQFSLDTCDILFIQSILERLSKDKNIL